MSPKEMYFFKNVKYYLYANLLQFCNGFSQMTFFICLATIKINFAPVFLKVTQYTKCDLFYKHYVFFERTPEVVAFIVV